jgi:hypothetical protein
MLNFKFNQPFYKVGDLLKIIPIPRSTFYKFQNEWINKGHDPADMGKVKINGIRYGYWDAQKFLNWLIANKIKGARYDYEVQEQEQVKQVLGFVKVEQGAKELR